MNDASTRGMPSPSMPGTKSMRGPMTLNGRTMVKGSAVVRPLAKITRSSSCLAQA